MSKHTVSIYMPDYKWLFAFSGIWKQFNAPSEMPVLTSDCGSKQNYIEIVYLIDRVSTE
jgi:hypothetical protein